MGKNVSWQDDYWLFLLQLYLQRPTGVKPLYCRSMVDLSLELHVPPKALEARMQQIAGLDTPRIEHIWQVYGDSPGRLARAVKLLRQMNGFGAATDFYEGVEVQETFEKDFRPLPEDERIKPVMLILILDLYFQLTPITMVQETPEVQQLARLIRLRTADVVQVLDIYQTLDPYLNRQEMIVTPLLLPCQQVWQRFANLDTRELSAYAGQLKAYFDTQN